MVKPTHTIHGCAFTRTGSCNGCGLCGCDKCLHAKKDGDTYTCTIYDKRAEVCEECTNNPDSDWYGGGDDVTHQQCIDFPSHPFVWVINEGKCGYKFTVDKQDKEKLSKIEVKY